MRPERKKIRLQGYDYSSIGVYHITICSKNREDIFWEKNIGISNDNLCVCETKFTNSTYLGGAQLSLLGEITEEAIQKISSIYSNIIIDKYCIMPNHIHMIAVIYPYDYNSKETRPDLSRMVKQLKGIVTKQAKSGDSVWQKSFYDEIIRNERAYQEIWHYIDENPINVDVDNV